MKTNIQGNPNLSWVLRILLIIMIILFTLLSMDAFREDKGIWETIVGLLMQNIPSFVMIIILIIAWKSELYGGILLMLCVIGFAVFLLSLGRFMWGTLIMLGIPFLIGALFVVNYYFLGKKPTA